MSEVITLKQIREAKRLFNAYQITEGEAGSMTLGKMLETVIRMDKRSDREYAEYLAQNRSPKRARR